MKIRYLLASCIILCFQSLAFSTESDQINFIKDEYKKIATLFINSDKESSPCISTCDIRLNAMPATSLSYDRATFYWELYTLDPKKEADSGNEGLRLRKSECYHQKGFRSEKVTSIYYEEFLFDGDGKVLFYYYKEGIGNIYTNAKCTWVKEERYYFDGSKVIRVIKGGKTDDNPDAMAHGKGKAILQQGKIMKDLAYCMNIRPLETVTE